MQVPGGAGVLLEILRKGLFLRRAIPLSFVPALNGAFAAISGRRRGTPEGGAREGAAGQVQAGRRGGNGEEAGGGGGRSSSDPEKAPGLHRVITFAQARAGISLVHSLKYPCQVDNRAVLRHMQRRVRAAQEDIRGTLVHLLSMFLVHFLPFPCRFQALKLDYNVQELVSYLPCDS